MPFSTRQESLKIVIFRLKGVVAQLIRITSLLTYFWMVAACGFQDQRGAAAASEAGAPPKPVLGEERMRSTNTQSSQPYAPGEVLVKFRNGIDEAQIERLQRETGLQPIKVVSAPYLYLMKITDGSAVEDMLVRLKQYPEIVYAEPNYTRSVKGN